MLAYMAEVPILKTSNRESKRRWVNYTIHVLAVFLAIGILFYCCVYVTVEKK